MSVAWLHYVTARKDYTCAKCQRNIVRGETYVRTDRPRLTYHRHCAPQTPTYALSSVKQKA
jgi:hypothetical protein